MCPPSPAGDDARPGRRDLDQLVATLTLDEKALLTAGADMWSTVAVERAGIPAVHLTDGPSGARGPWLFGVGTSSVCVPCGTALGATWDPSLVEEVGDMLGGEARSRGCRVLLAPTVNIHRSPSPAATSSAIQRTHSCRGRSPWPSSGVSRHVGWRRP